MAVPSPAGQPELRWTDAAADATGFFGESSTPRPSDPELDILEARYSFSGSNLVTSVKVEQIGMPFWSNASVFRFHFRSGKDSYYLQSVIGTSAEYLILFFDGGGPTFSRVSAAGRETLECECRATFDFEKDTATISISKQSLMKAVNVPVGHLDLRDLRVETLGHQPTTYWSSDTAPAPEGSALRH
jgi:hypothetical protein